MRSLVGTSYDSLESFCLQEIATPEPTAGQVRIRIEATALGFVDGLMVQGRYQVKPPLPYIPGAEIVGIVDAVGPDVHNIKIGDKVATWQLGGGLAEYIAVNASQVDVVTADLNSAIIAAMLVDYQTSHYGLFECGRLSAADTVLVLGATGGVGSAAVQMAARAGAYVIAAAASDEKRAMAMRLGARATVNYLEPNWRDALKKMAPQGSVDVVFDPVGGDAFEPAFRSLARGGRYLCVGFAGGRIPTLPINLALLKNASLIGVQVTYFGEAQPEKARRTRQALFAMVANGFLLPPAMVEFPLARSREALQATLSRDKKGKAVVLPAL